MTSRIDAAPGELPPRSRAEIHDFLKDNLDGLVSQKLIEMLTEQWYQHGIECAEWVLDGKLLV